jgi:hypothetical protein
MFKPFKLFKTIAGLFDGLTDLNGLLSINSGPEQHVEGNYLNWLRVTSIAFFRVKCLV